MATKRSEVVTLEGLSAALEKAFEVAGKRHGAVFDPGTVVLNWEIFGRRIKSLEQAKGSQLDIASSVVSAMKLKNAQPTVVGFDKWILVGFWDPRIRDVRDIGVGPLR